MKSIYISGPLTTYGDRRKNVINAAKAAAYYASEGYMIFCPHTMTDMIDELTPDIEKLPYEYWIELSLYWLDRCDIIVMLPDWQHSKGCTVEIARARSNGTQILYWKEEEA